MIAKLTGVLDSVGTDWAIVDVGGVGYLVYCSGRTLRRLDGAGSAVSLRIETHVREDHIHLYGFIDTVERDWFRILTTVQGVGSRVALSLLTTLDPDRLAQAIAAQDKVALAQADGVGPKLANRIASELKDKVPALASAPALSAADLAAGAPAAAEAGSAAADAVSALVNLGYRRAEAFTAIAAASRRAGPDAAAGELIRLGLRELAS